VELTKAYEDKAVITKEINGIGISSSSQPAIMAIMLEQLNLQPGQRVLEIGAGTGFNAALMAHLVGDASPVTTVDIDDDLVKGARANLAAAGFGGVSVVCADGGEGYRPNAAYDRVILTVGAWDISPAWVEQLREGGILLLPLDFNSVQLSVAFEKRDGVLRSRSVQCCGFIRLRGDYAGPNVMAALDESGRTLVEAADVERLNLAGLRALLAEQPEIGQLSLPGDWLAHFSLRLWLALNGALLIGLKLDEPASGLGAGWYEGILETEAASLCLVGHAEANAKPLYTYGGPAARARLQAMVADWQAKGSPDPRAVRVTAYPVEAQVKPADDEWVLCKQWWQYVVKW
jgi:protein-L-isoaspartate(D-aspartate) O-methyltransferase